MKKLKIVKSEQFSDPGLKFIDEDGNEIQGVVKFELNFDSRTSYQFAKLYFDSRYISQCVDSADCNCCDLFTETYEVTSIL